MHRAARDGDTSAIRRLIDNGDNINGITYNGRTALHYATANQNLDAVYLLINLGAWKYVVISQKLKMVQEPD